MLTGYFPVEGGRESALGHIRENCGWELRIADDLKEIEPPTLEELKSARIFDPHCFFLGKGD